MNRIKRLFHSPKHTNKNDLFFGLHIHKTAGISMIAQFKSELKSEQYYINSMHALNFKENARELEERLPNHIKHLRLVFGHDVREYMLTFFQERDIKLFTFLRNPIERIISLFCYNKLLLARLGHTPPDFQIFYNRFFPHFSQCAKLTSTFPSFIDDLNAPLHLQAISILKKFHFIATLDDYPQKAPKLFKEMGIFFTKEYKSNATGNKESLLENECIDVDILREDNIEDIKLMEIINENKNNKMLNYLGTDHKGLQKSLDKIFSRPINPFSTLHQAFKGPIRDNYILENVSNQAHLQNKRELAITLIKLYALEEDTNQKELYRSLLDEFCRNCSLESANILSKQ